MGMKADGNLYIAAQFLDTFDEIGKQVEKGVAKISNNTKIDLSLDEKNILKEINSMLGSTKFKDLDLSDIVSSVFASISKEGMSSKDRTKILDDFQYNLRMFHTAPFKTIKQLKGVKSENLTGILQEIQTDSLSDNPKRQWTSSNLKNNIKEIIDEHLKTVIDNTVDSIQEALVQEFGKDTAKYGVSGKEANNRLNNIYDSLVQEADKQSKQYKSNVDLSEVVSDNDLKSIQGFYSRIESLGEMASDKAKKLADMLTSMSNDGAIEEGLDDIIYQISEDVNSFTEREKQLIQETKQQQKEIDELNAQNKSSSRQKIKPNFNVENQEQDITSTIFQSAEKENKIQETKTQQQENKKIIEQANEITATESKTVDIKKQQTQEIEKQNDLLKKQKQIKDETTPIKSEIDISSQDQVQQEIQETASTAQSAVKSNEQLAESVQEVTQAVQQEGQVFSNTEKQIEKNNSILYHYGDYNKNKPSHQFGDEKRAWFNGIDNQGVGYADGTGTYVSNHIDEYSPSRISDKVSKKFYSIDVSKLNLYEAHTEEQAEIFYKFIHHLEQYCIMLGSGFEGFADNLKNVDAQSLYQDFKKVFPSIEMSFEEFNDFISRMKNLVIESGMDNKGEINPKKLLEFKNKNGIDDIKTRFLKELGYHGTNLSGTSYGGLRNGSVLFDDNARLFTVTSGKLLSDVAQETEEIVNSQKNILQKHNIKISSEDLIGASSVELEQIRNLLKEIYDNEIQLQNVKSGSKIESSIKEKINEAKSKIEEIKNNISQNKEKEKDISQEGTNNQLNVQGQELNQIQEEKLDTVKEELQTEQQITNELKEQKNIKQTSKEISKEDKKEAELQTIKEIKEEAQQVAEQQQKITEARQETAKAAQEELKTEQQLSAEVQNQEKAEEKKTKVTLVHNGKKLPDVQRHGKTQTEINAQIKAEEEKKKKKSSTPKSDLEEKKRVEEIAAADAKEDEIETINNLNFMAALRAKLAEAEARQAEKEAQKIQLTSEQMQKLKQGIQEATEALKEYKEIDEQIIKAQSDKDSLKISKSTQDEMLNAGAFSSFSEAGRFIQSAYRAYKKSGNEQDEIVLKEALKYYMSPVKRDEFGNFEHRPNDWLFGKKDKTGNYKEIKAYKNDKKYNEYIENAQKENAAYENAVTSLPLLEEQKQAGQHSYVEASTKIQQLLQETGLDAEKVNEILAAINGNLTNEEAIWKVINSYIKEATEELEKQDNITEKKEFSALENTNKEAVSNENIEQTDIVEQQEKNQQAVEKTIELTEKAQEQVQELTDSKIPESTVVSEIGKEAESTKEKLEKVVDSVEEVKNKATSKSVNKEATKENSEFSYKEFARGHISETNSPFIDVKKWMESGVKTDNIKQLETYYEKYNNIKNRLKATKDKPENKANFKLLIDEYDSVRKSVMSVLDVIEKLNSEENKMLASQKAHADIIKGTINNRATLAQSTQKRLDSDYYDKQVSKTENILSQYTSAESPEAAKAIEQTNNALEKYKNIIIELKQFNSGELQLDRPFEELIEEVNKADVEVKELTKNIQDNFSKVANSNSIIDLQSQIKSILSTYNRISPEGKQKLEDIFGSLKIGETTTKQLANFRTQLRATIAEERELGNLSSTIFDRMVGKMQEGIAFLATKVSFYEIFNQFRQGFEIIHEFDDALTEMMKVSDETRTSLERYQKTTFETADAIGTSALQIQNSTADFMRLGMGTNVLCSAV